MFNRLETIDAQLPAVAVRDFIPLPANEIRIDFSSDQDLKTLKIAEQYKNYIVLMVPEKSTGMLTEHDFYRRAVVAKIALNMTSPNGTRRVKFQTIVRCDIKAFLPTNISTTAITPQLTADI
jgi:ATP-dependent Lon protease